MDFCQAELEVSWVESSDTDYDVKFYGSLIERYDLQKIRKRQRSTKKRKKSIKW